MSIPLSLNENWLFGAWTVSDASAFPDVRSFTDTLYETALLRLSHVQIPCVELPLTQAGGVGLGVGVGPVHVFSGLWDCVPEPHSFVGVTVHIYGLPGIIVKALSVAFWSTVID